METNEIISIDKISGEMRLMNVWNRHIDSEYTTCVSGFFFEFICQNDSKFSLELLILMKIKYFAVVILLLLDDSIFMIKITKIN